MEQVLILILCILGLAITGYIIFAHASNRKVVCPSFSKDCNKVLDSKWSRIFMVKNEILGFLYYLGVFVVTGLSLTSSDIIFALKGFVVLSVLYSLFLTAIQSKKLKHFCFYCICTAIINFLLFLLIVL
ncbi:hypothetical protein J4416_01920 [Candidatus Pacearchaeota archaeon]|nr:hypothetical protein [Candidatus Pacearchaeota archaeon]